MSLELALRFGKRWTHEKYDRVYINNLCDLYGLEYSTFNTGNICNATLDGAKISNNKATKIRYRLEDAKLWWDVPTATWSWKGLTEDDAQKIIDKIEERIETNGQ